MVGLGGHQDLDDFCEMPVVSSVPIKRDVDILYGAEVFHFLSKFLTASSG